MQGNRSKSAVLVYYFRVTTKMINNEKIPKEVIVETYDQVIDIIDWNIKNNPKKKSDFENARGNIELTFEPYASCEDLIGIYAKKFDEQGDDPEVLTKIVKMLDKKGCTDSELFFDVTVKLYDLQPTPESAFLIGRMYVKREDYSKATEYLIAGTEMEDVDKRADCFLLLADCFRNLKNYSKARTYALNVTEIRPEDGNPYILIGDMYAASAKECGSNDLTNKVAYWAAVDKYYKAKNVDSSIADAANERISTYSRVFPTTEIIFFHDLKEGDPYKVECWINETTTVRAAK
jgi:tetratricopeptide (TPR) repeat protein